MIVTAGIMQVLKYYSNFFIPIFCAVFLCLGCEDLPRDNILDPKNPSSRTDQIVVIEAFVNTNEDLPPYNFWMLDALKTLKDKYTDKVIICEYHRTIGMYDDPFAIRESDFIQDSYTEEKGVPDVFLNGSVVNIRGSSGPNNSLNRLEMALQDLLNKNSFFEIEPEISRNGNSLKINAVIARLGSKSAGNIFLRAVVKEYIDATYHRNVVRDIVQSTTIERINPGDKETLTFETVELGSGGPYSLVLIVSSSENMENYQAREVLVP